MLSDVPSSKDFSKLAIAAEELVKAACTHVESTSLEIGKETVKGLKKLSMDSSSIEKSVASLKESTDAKLNTLNQSLSNIKDQLVLLNANVALQVRNQKLEWAISHSDIGSFEFYVKGDRYKASTRYKSSAFVTEVLLNFRKGVGHYITDRSMSEYRYDYTGKLVQGEEGEMQFRDALSAQIHKLIGHKPKIEVSDGKVAIYYS